MKRMNYKVLSIIAIVVIGLFLINLSPLFAATPTPQDIAFAKTLIMKYKVQENDQKNLQKEIIKNSNKINSAKSLEPYMTKNLVFIHNFYKSIKDLTPTPAFKLCYTNLVNTSIAHQKFLSKTIDLCNNNVDLQTFKANTAAHKQGILGNYQKFLTDYFAVVNSWPKQDAQQVMDAYNQ